MSLECFFYGLNCIFWQMKLCQKLMTGTTRNFCFICLIPIVFLFVNPDGIKAESTNSNIETLCNNSFENAISFPLDFDKQHSVRLMDIGESDYLSFSFNIGDCNVLPTDVLQPGYAIYVKRVYNSVEDTVLVIRDISGLAARYNDPANLASNSVDNGPYAPITRVWRRSQFEGNDLLGLTFDPRNREIYAATGVIYNNENFISNFAGTVDAKVYKISADGNTIDILATLPGNKGIGWIDIDTIHNQVYASNFDDGLIYVIPLSGGLNQTGPFITYSIFPPDEINEASAPTAPDWNMAPLGQRIFNVSFNHPESRLYYSIWANDVGGVPPTTDLNYVRSVEIDMSGSIAASTDVLEITIPVLYNGTYSNPVSDIEFDFSGSRMLLAEQGVSSEVGQGGNAHSSRILEYQGSTGNWLAEPTDKFLIGTCCGGPAGYSGTDARGGIAFAPGAVYDGNTIGSQDFIIATADAVSDDYNLPDHRRWVDGAGFMPSTGSYSSLQVLGLDLDGDRTYPNKGAYGDIEVFTCPLIPVPYDLALVKTVNSSVSSGPFQNGSTVSFKIRVYNQGTQATQSILVRDQFPASLVLADANWSLINPGVAERTINTIIEPGNYEDITIDFTVNTTSGSITNYAEIISLQDILGNSVVDSDSDGSIGAGNDINELDNYIYGINSSQDIDDIDPATIWVGTVGIGNLVYIDDNRNNLFDSGEGIEGVKVYLFRPGFGADGVIATSDDGMVVDSTVTDINGEYSFLNLSPGRYYVQIPYFEFNNGGHLPLYSSVPGNGADNSIDDNADENGIDENGMTMGSPLLMGVNSELITLLPGQESTSELGFNGGSDTPDADIDYSVDFGFYSGVGIGNLVWLDLNDNNLFDIGEGIGGIAVNLYRPNYGPDGITGTADDNDIVNSTLTNGGGHYYFQNLPNGDYVVEIPSSNFQNTLLSYAVSIPGNGADNGVDDDIDENGIDEGISWINGVRSDTIHLQIGTEPTTSESGSEGSFDQDQDNNNDLTIDFGFKPTVGLGNVVWIDTNNDGVYTTGEGINGVLVELYQPGFGPDKIAGTADDNDVVSSFTTVDIGFGPGTYFFPTQPGVFQVRIPASQFQFGGSLYGYLSILAGGGDNQIDDNVDENGIDNNNPAANGISSALITLDYGTEPINEPGFLNFAAGPLDSYLDFTVDFGFFYSPCIISDISITVNPCNPSNNLYSVDGTLTFNNPPATGTITLTVSGGGSTVLNPPFASPQSFSITGLNSDGAVHTITATFSVDPSCTYNKDITAPVDCSTVVCPVKRCATVKVTKN